jgi:hypothetical protein
MMLMPLLSVFDSKVRSLVVERQQQYRLEKLLVVRRLKFGSRGRIAPLARSIFARPAFRGASAMLRMAPEVGFGGVFPIS